MFAQRGPVFVAFAALLVASSSFAQRSSGYSRVSESLSVIDITLEAPVNAQTCEPVSFEWTWSGLGEEPTDPVSLSIINASDFGRRRKRASNRSHIDFDPSYSQSKRAIHSAYSIPGASSIAFDEETFEWTAFAVAPGSYRLLLTVDESSQSVVSDPFTVSSGTDTSCLTSSSAFSSTSASPEQQSSDGALTSTSANPVTSQSSASEASRTSAPASSSVSATSGSSSSSSSVATGSTQASSGASNTSSNSSSSSSSSGSSTNAGGIAAGILVPLLLLGGGALFWRWYKSRQDTAGRLAGQSPGSSWSEKFFGGGSGAAADGSHGISGPTAATRSGLAAVAALVPEELRTEKEAAALRAEAAKTSRSRPMSGASQSTNGDAAHWIDFASDDGHNVDGARPLSPSTIDDAARRSVEQLYQQGRNVPLSQTYSRGDLSYLHDSFSTIGAPSSGHRTISTFGTPAADPDTDADEVGSLRQLRIDAMDTQRSSTLTASTVGRDLIAAMPQPPRTTATDAAQSPFGDDQAVAVAPSIAATSPAPGLERAGSTGSIFKSKRKAVPRLSAGEPVSAAKDPFSDSTDSAIAEHPLARSATPTPTPAATLEAPSTPRQQQSTLRHAATPRNVPHTPRAESIISEQEHEEVLSEADAVIDDEAAERARQYHLSLNLPIDSDAGFRVSFS